MDLNKRQTGRFMGNGVIFIPPGIYLERRCAMKKKVIAGTIVVSLLAALIILKKKGEM